MTVKAVVADGLQGHQKESSTRLCADVEVQAGSKAYWFRLDENGELAGGISKFLQEREGCGNGNALGLKAGDFVGCMRRQLKQAAQKTAGVLRKILGAASKAI